MKEVRHSNYHSLFFPFCLVEFNYAEVTTNTLPATVGTDNKAEVKAKTLFFVLSGDNKDHMLDSEDGKAYGTASLHLTESTELTELLNK
ncbi:hypothetical protein [Brevibacillus brevis]|nr:hypothetical protein [Brevibacillus brevis]GEC87798.1 hypothetical protein BBR01nite_01290 [Brevibacillus brevis]